jgi:hypothetical protein
VKESGKSKSKLAAQKPKKKTKPLDGKKVATCDSASK